MIDKLFIATQEVAAHLDDFDELLDGRRAIAAKIGNDSKVKQIALIHFDANRYSSFAQRDTAERAAKRICKNIRAMRDNMEIVV